MTTHRISTLPRTLTVILLFFSHLTLTIAASIPRTNLSPSLLSLHKRVGSEPERNYTTISGNPPTNAPKPPDPVYVAGRRGEFTLKNYGPDWMVYDDANEWMTVWIMEEFVEDECLNPHTHPGSIPPYLPAHGRKQLVPDYDIRGLVVQNLNDVPWDCMAFWNLLSDIRTYALFAFHAYGYVPEFEFHWETSGREEDLEARGAFWNPKRPPPVLSTASDEGGTGSGNGTAMSDSGSQWMGSRGKFVGANSGNVSLS